MHSGDERSVIVWFATTTVVSGNGKHDEREGRRLGKAGQRSQNHHDHASQHVQHNVDEAPQALPVILSDLLILDDDRQGSRGDRPQLRGDVEKRLGLACGVAGMGIIFFRV
jgi:hypothetical protein